MFQAFISLPRARHPTIKEKDNYELLTDGCSGGKVGKESRTAAWVKDSKRPTRVFTFCQQRHLFTIYVKNPRRSC